MFCQFCGRQNNDAEVFCKFCGKALPSKNLSSSVTQPFVEAYPNLQESSQKPRLSFNAKKGIVTGLLIVIVVLVALVIYYPGIFHW